MLSPRTRWIAASGALVLALSACSPSDDNPASSSEASASSSVTVTDNHGEQTLETSPKTVVATDNRVFETLDSWDIPLAAAPKAIMPKTVSYTDNEDVINLGNHREPDLEAVVAANPDLVLNGQRFADYYDDFKELTPDAKIVELDPRDDKPFAEELKRQITELGKIFNKNDEATKLTKDFDSSIERVKNSYKEGDTVMAVNVSGGEIGYIAPSKGRTLGPVFDLFNFKPALEIEGASDNHQGDDISVEAMADANPDWILVLDRDAAINPGDGYTPAKQVIEDSEALSNVTAVREGNVIYMPEDTYTNEGIQTYTEFFNSLADSFEKKN